MQWLKAGRDLKAGAAEPWLARPVGEALAERDGPASRHRHWCSLNKRALAGPGREEHREPCAHTAATGKMHDLFVNQLLLKEPTNLHLRGKR